MLGRRQAQAPRRRQGDIAGHRQNEREAARAQPLLDGPQRIRCVRRLQQHDAACVEAGGSHARPIELTGIEACLRSETTKHGGTCRCRRLRIEAPRGKAKRESQRRRRVTSSRTPRQRQRGPNLVHAAHGETTWPETPVEFGLPERPIATRGNLERTGVRALQHLDAGSQVTDQRGAARGRSTTAAGCRVNQRDGFRKGGRNGRGQPAVPGVGWPAHVLRCQREPAGSGSRRRYGRGSS